MCGEKTKKIAIAAALGCGVIIGLAVGYGWGYSAGIEKAMEISQRFINITWLPGAEERVLAWLTGGT